jgi:hypothetical protein
MVSIIDFMHWEREFHLDVSASIASMWGWTFIVKAVACHFFFSMVSFYNDLNVLHRSPVFSKLVEAMLVVSYMTR